MAYAELALVALMTGGIEEETFAIALRLGGAEIIGFSITSRSSRGKRWAFFGLLVTIVMVGLFVAVEPQLREYLR